MIFEFDVYFYSRTIKHFDHILVNKNQRKIKVLYPACIVIIRADFTNKKPYHKNTFFNSKCMIKARLQPWGLNLQSNIILLNKNIVSIMLVFSENYAFWCNALEWMGLSTFLGTFLVCLSLVGRDGKNISSISFAFL